MPKKDYLKLLNNEPDWTRYGSAFGTFVNVVRHGQKPLSLVDRKKKAPLIPIRSSYELNFGQNKSFEIAKATKVVEAFMHNEGKRVTVLFRGRGAWTFDIKPAKPYKSPAKWDGIIRGKHIALEVSFEINKKPREEGGVEVRPPGFQIKGTGFDDGNKFTIKSDYVKVDPHDFLNPYFQQLILQDHKE